MADKELALMAHLLRRAGFGATRDELEAYTAKGYEATVEELLNPGDLPMADEYILTRYDPQSGVAPGMNYPGGTVGYMYNLVNTKRPLEEKMTLLWHMFFATSMSKVGNYNELYQQIHLFRQHALGNYRDLLLRVAKNPAMIYWLDQHENHKYAVNENWGRELLELFSMGVGNYTETDVREASRAFTGWSVTYKVPHIPHGSYLWDFQYKPEDHDDGVKSFLGHTGQFNGEDIIDILVQQPATARFVSRHLYNFFVADEPPVPGWSTTPPRDEAAIQYLAKVFMESQCEMRPILRALFNSDFFKNSRFTRVKSPAELVAGILRLVGGHYFPTPFHKEWALQPTYMGQDVLRVPSVEGWHTGHEWITSGTFMSRVNFLAEKIGDPNLPGVQAIVGRVRERGSLSPEEFVDWCLDLMGPLEEMDPETRQELVAHAQGGGTLSWETEEEVDASTKRVVELLQMIVGTLQYQFA